MIAGPDAPTHGEAKNSWLTGTAAWNYVAATQWIIGVRPEIDGLRIDPHLPADLGEIQVLRRFRGTLYRIVVRREPAIDHGWPSVSRLVVDGRPIDGNVVPLPGTPGGEIRVEAIVGPADVRS
jgi:cellobiose phosphorylase